MNRPAWVASAALLLAAVSACGGSASDDGDGAATGTGSVTPAPPPGSSGTSGPSSPPGPTTEKPPPRPPDVSLKLLTYNVAGLPDGLSGSKPSVNTPQMSPKLNPFDLVVVQEDFSYHAELVSQATHPHKSTPMKAPSPVDLGDGLNVLSRFALGSVSRTKWDECNGTIDQKNDCLTSKGFARVTVDLGPGMAVDLYDVHFDAGRSEGDAKARTAQVKQLVSVIAKESAGRAVIVAGDTNMKPKDAADAATLDAMLKGAGLTCACRTLSCPEPARIDRVMSRSSASVTVAAKTWQVESSFVDASGEPLSDHDPVSVVLELTKN